MYPGLGTRLVFGLELNARFPEVTNIKVLSFLLTLALSHAWPDPTTIVFEVIVLVKNEKIY